MATYGTLNIENLTSSTGGVISPNITSLRNRIINGAMVIDQRNAGAVINPAVNANYTVDRWLTRTSQTSLYKIQQNAGAITPPTGFVNYLGATSLAATTFGSGDYAFIAQTIEGFNGADLNWGTANAKTVTLSFWVYSSLTGTFGGSFRSYNGANYNYVYSYTITNANTWQYVTITIPGPTSTFVVNNTNGGYVELDFCFGCGSAYVTTPGSWTGAGNYLAPTGQVNVCGTSGATWYITGVQLEVGAQATSFDYRPYGTELALCQRYYFQNTGLASTTTNFGSATSISATQAYIQVPFPVSMRAGPTISYGGTVNVSDSNTYDLAISAIVTNQSNTNYGSGKVTTASGQTLYRPQTLWVNSTTSFLAFTAEL